MALRLLKYVPMSLLRALAQITASFAYTFKTSIYRNIDKNITIVRPFLSKKERDKLVYQSLKNQMTSTVDSAKSWAMPPKWSIEQIKNIHHNDILQAGLNHPNGMLIIAPHIGTWEMMNAWMCQFNKLTIMYKPINNEKIDNFILQGRKNLNVQLVPTDASGVKAIFKTLKEGGFSVLLPDHVPHQQGGEIVPFFGIPTITSTLASKLAQKTNCALVGLACIKCPNGQGFEIFCYDFNNTDLYHKDIKIATTALNQAMQSMIEKHFTHYMWSYRRFKNTPFGENPYLLPLETLHQLVQDYKSNQQPKD